MLFNLDLRGYSKFVQVYGNDHAEEVSFDGRLENLRFFDLSLTLGRPTQYSLLLCVSQHRWLNAIGH
jgi:hypothetical protein